jgi:hypothetical protein
MVKDYDKLLSKNLIYGSKANCKDLVEIGNTVDADEQFQMTVAGLDQKFSLVPNNVKEAYLIHMIKSAKLKKNQ